MLATVCLVACDKEDDPTTSSPRLVTIDPIITRATEVNFENEDKIGLTITKEGGEVVATNSQLTFANNVFSGSLEWYSEANEKSELSAYYPYSANGIPTSFTVASDQSKGYSSSDLIAGYKSDVTPTENAVSMNFKHLLTRIVIETVNQSGAGITTVILKGSIPTAKINIPNMSVEVDETQATADILTQQVEADTKYHAIVIPQTVALNLEVKTTTGETLTQQLGSHTLVQGGQYTINARVLPGELYVSLTGEIEDWNDEGTIGSGDEGDEEGENYIIYAGIKYKTVTFSNGTTWMAEPLRYLPAGCTPSTDPTEDSHIWYPYSLTTGSAVALTDETSIEKYGYLYDFYVALGGKEITEINYLDFEGKQGICPTGWHIPTRADYLDLVGLSNKNDLGETGPQTNTNAIFFDTTYGAGKITKANEVGFNYIFAGVRMQSTFTHVPVYQPTLVTTTNCSVEDWIGLPSVNHYLTSTGYKPAYNSETGELTNIQFFSMMSTFSSNYKEGRMSLGYIGIKSGAQIRCVKD